MDELLKNRQMLHPRILLSTAARVVQHAVTKKASSIDAACVKEGMDIKTSLATGDVSEGIGDAL
jgi:hypothetical protein